MSEQAVVLINMNPVMELLRREPLKASQIAEELNITPMTVRRALQYLYSAKAIVQSDTGHWTLVDV